MRRRTRAAASLALALAVLVVFLRVVGPARVARDLAAARPVPAALAALLAVGGFLAWGESLRQLHVASGGRVDPLRFRLAFLGGVFAKQLLPAGNASGPAFVAYAVNGESGERYEHDLAVATVGELFNLAASLVVATAGVLVLAATGAGGVLLAAFGAVIAVAAVLVSALLALLFARRTAFDALVRRVAAGVRVPVGRFSARVAAALAPARVDAWLGGFGRPLAAIAADRRAAGLGFAYSLLGWTAIALSLFAAGLALGTPLSVALVLFVVPVGGFASVVPLPGGVGGIEVATAGLLVAVGTVDLVAATGAVLLFRLASFWLVLLVGGAASVYTSLTLADAPELLAGPE